MQIDVTGAVLVDEADVGDGLQGPLDMYPAIGLGPDGAVHVVTRNGGSGSGGTTVEYAERGIAGSWSAGVTVGAVVARNDSVGVAVPAGGRVLVGVSRNVEGSAARGSCTWGMAARKRSTTRGTMRRALRSAATCR